MTEMDDRISKNFQIMYQEICKKIDSAGIQAAVQAPPTPKSAAGAPAGPQSV